MQRPVWIVQVFLAGALVAGCSGNDRNRDGAPADADSGVDSADVADADGSASPLPERASLTSGKTTVVVETDPFALSLRGPSGAERTRLADRDHPAFDGLSVAEATGWRASLFFDPRLPDDGTGAGLDWYSASRAVDFEDESPDADAGPLRLDVRTTGADGEEGPELEVTIRGTSTGVAVDVTAPDRDELVHTALNWRAKADEGFYGLGEHFDDVDLRGSIRAMQIRPEGDSESTTNEVHVPIPFYLSTRDYGMFVEDRHPAAFDLGATHSEVVRATWNSREVTYRLFVDDGPMALVESYTDITGKPASVPYWALAPQWWRNETDGQSEVLDDAQRGRNSEIPSTLIWIDRPWSSYYHNWKFNDSQFPDPQTMFDDLHDLGYRVLLHHSPQMNVPGTSDIGEDEDVSEMLYQTYKENGWLVKNNEGNPVKFPWGGGKGAFVDYSHPDAVDHMQQMITRVTRFGAVGTKMDWDEFLAPNLDRLKLRFQFHNGETNQTMHDWYSALYHRAIIEGFDEGLGRSTFHISRSGAPGDQKWNTCIWPGDLDNDFSPHTRGPSEFQEEWNVGGLPSAITANQTLGMSGYPCFGSDIGGFRNGEPGAEVLMRWVAFGTFNAVMQLGGGGSTHMAWTHDSPYDQQVLDVTRTYFELRMQLFPYIFRGLRRAARTGRPLVRSMYLAFPEDERARSFEDQFMFGPDLLVAPVHEAGARSRTVYLPPGDWIDFWTGERHGGGQTVDRDAPLDLIPLFVRRGAQIPLAPGGIDTLVPAPDPAVTSYPDDKTTRVRIFAAEERTEREYFNGLAVTSVAKSEGGVDVDVAIGSPEEELADHIEFAPEEIVLEIEAPGTDFANGPSSVELRSGGTSQSLSEGSNCTQCWSFTASRKLLEVHLDQPGTVEIR